jgi:predicted outer membrane repeat protein
LDTSFGAGRGGAILNSGNAIISNSTFSGNSATSGGGIYNNGTATLQNTIVASSGGNCGGSTVTSDGYNLSSDNTCNLGGPGDLNNINPKIGPLQNNGGTTQTMALLTGSPAIDAGNPNGCTDGKGNLLTTDQRGMPRPDSEDTRGCDMGAYESQSDQP